jgi:hypothetical protein
MANVPIPTWSQTTPAGSDNVSSGDDRIREMKDQLQQIISADHEMTTTQSASTGGQHKQITMQESTGSGFTGAVSATVLHSKTVGGKGELTYRDEDDTDVQITTGGVLKPSTDTTLANWAAVMALIYPVGSVYTNAAVSTNPGTLLGIGTWVAIEGECIVGLVAGGEFDTLGTVSEGAATVKLTGGESGTSAHTHTIPTGAGTGTSATASRGSGATLTLATSASSEANADDSHNNIQPSYVCYVWRRTVYCLDTYAKVLYL